MLAEIVENKPINKVLYSLWVKVEEAYKLPLPGQFFLLYIDNVFLGRPLTPVDVSKTHIRFIYIVKGRGTLYLSGLTEGKIRIEGPFGKGIVPEKDKILLIAGGVGIAPLIYLMRFHESKHTDLLYGVKNVSELLSESEYMYYLNNSLIITEDGSKGKKGLVTHYIKEEDYDEFFVCGPLGMLKTIQQMDFKKPVYLFLEDMMGCAQGLCNGCAVKSVNGGYIRTCIKGPVFETREIIL